MCVDVGKDVYGVSRHFRNGGGVEVVLASCCQPEPFGKEEAHHNGGLFALDNADGFVCRCCGVQSEEALPELPCVRMWQLGVYPLGVEVLDAHSATGVQDTETLRPHQVEIVDVVFIAVMKADLVFASVVFQLSIGRRSNNEMRRIIFNQR